MCEPRVGSRCKVCTRCGRCPGVVSDITVVANSCISDEPLFRSNPKARLIVVDIGTTTIPVKVLNPKGETQGLMPSKLREEIWSYVNPQTTVGADVISRIQYASTKEGLLDLQSRVQELVGQVICGDNTGASNNEAPETVIIAGNTTMSYIFRGLDPSSLGRAPFPADHLETARVEVQGVDCIVLPGLSAFVGGDIVSGIYATGMYESEDISLLIDMGTNGEMVLGNKDRMIATSTACGPAFEGDRSQNMWGSDLIKCVAELVRRGIVDETGLLADEYFDEGITVGGFTITQQQIRSLQLAKSAIASGIHILLKEYGVDMMSIRKVYLAGGMGFFLEEEAAVSIGLIPPEFLGRTVPAGNTSLLGAEKLARKGLLSVEQISEELRPITEGAIKVINLAEYPGFDEEYLANCSLGVDRCGTL